MCFYKIATVISKYRDCFTASFFCMENPDKFKESEKGYAFEKTFLQFTGNTGIIY